MEKRDKIVKLILCFSVIGLVIALFISFAEINVLRDSIDNLNANFYSNIDTVNRNIESIYDNVDEKLKKQSSILSGYNAQYNNLDTINYTTPIEFTVTPKTLSDDTEVLVTLGGKTTVLNRVNETFKGVIDTDVFMKDNAIPLVSVKSKGNIQNEYLEENFECLFKQFMPYLTAQMTVTEEKFLNEKVRLTGDIAVDYKPSSAECETAFTKYLFIVSTNGKEIYNKDITKDIEASNGEIRDFSVTFSADVRDSFTYYIVATDSFGFIHKQKVICNYVGNGNSITQEIDTTIDGWGEIFDSKGNILYGK